MNLHAWGRFQLWRINRTLRRIAQAPIPPLDIDPVRREVHRNIEGLRVESMSDQAYQAIDEFIDRSLLTHIRPAVEHLGRVNQRLNDLTARVAALRSRAEALHEHDQIHLRDLDAALTHALDRAADPDTPYFDPRRPRTEQA